MFPKSINTASNDNIIIIVPNVNFKNSYMIQKYFSTSHAGMYSAWLHGVIKENF